MRKTRPALLAAGGITLLVGPAFALGANARRPPILHTNATASLTLNGQGYTVPRRGTVHKTVVTDNGQTVTHIVMTGNQTTKNGTNDSSVSIKVNQRVNNGVP